MDGHLYDMVLRDCPGVSFFPSDTLSEWAEFHGYGLHSSQVYVLVFDVTKTDTFNYVKSMRDQIMKTKGDDVMMIIVGSKQDMADHRMATFRSHFTQMAKKWKCPLIICSAKYNWNIMNIFKEILKTIEAEIDSKKEIGNRNNARWRLDQCKIS